METENVEKICFFNIFQFTDKIIMIKSLKKNLDVIYWNNEES